MGAACDTICSRQQSINQIQPDTDTIKSRTTGTAMSETASIISDVTPTPNTPSKQHSLIEDFHQAIQQGDNNMVTFYLEEYPSYNLLNKPSKNNDTGLQTAVKHKQHNTLQKLLEEGALVNTKNVLTGNTALHLAATLNDIESVKILLKFNADVYITNNNEVTALSIAQQYEYKDILNEFGEESKTHDDLLQSSPDIHSSGKYNNDFLSPSEFADDILSDSPGIVSDSPTNEDILTTFNTTRLGSITDDLLDDIQTTMTNSFEKLPTLQNWVDKKQSVPPYSWLKRWVVVTEGYLLWSDRQISVDKGLTKEEKKRWNNCINLRKIDSVSAITKKKQRRFKVSIKNNRDYIWRAKTTDIRDKWVKGLKEHIDHANMSSVYSSTRKIDLP